MDHFLNSLAEFRVKACSFSNKLAKEFDAHAACGLATSCPQVKVRSVRTIDDEPLPRGVARISPKLDDFGLKLQIHGSSFVRQSQSGR